MKKFTDAFKQSVSNTFRKKTPEELIAEKEKKEDIWDIIKFAIIALLIVIPVRLWIAQPFIVSGESMYPTFHNSEYLIVDEISYRVEDPHRGDVIIFRYPKDPKRFFIKRIIALPGETINITKGTVTIKNTENPTGFVLDESFLKVPTEGMVSTTLKDDEYFVMGDNRIASSDSRSWGVLPEKDIVGRALVRVLPLGRFGFMPGSENGQEASIRSITSE